MLFAQLELFLRKLLTLYVTRVDLLELRDGGTLYGIVCLR